MKNKMNFRPSIELETRITPHAAYAALAVDAALIHFNEELPNLDAATQEQLIIAARLAAETVLRLGQVPDNWLGFVEALHCGRGAKVRQELWEIIDAHLPEPSSLHTEAKVEAINRLRALAKPGSNEAMRRALFELENAYLGQTLSAIEDAFRLGYQIAHDPTPLLFEQGTN